MSNDIVDRRSLTNPSQTLAAHEGRWKVDYLLKVVVLAGAYCLTGELGLLLAIPPGYATAIWLPSGIALAGILRWGTRVWPGVWLGSFLVNVWVALMPPDAQLSFAGLAVAASIGVGSTLQAVLGAALLERWVGTSRLFARGSAILAFASIEALCCFLAPTWGVTSLWLAGIVEGAAYFESWRTWWLGDLIGVLVVAPVILVWRQFRHVDWQPRRLAEAIGSLALLAVITTLVFFGPSALAGGSYPLAFLPLPCLVWLAFRFDPGGVAVATTLLSGIAVSATSLGSGPFVRDVTGESLLLLQAFTGLATLIGLSMAAAVNGHRQAETALQQLNAELEQRVREQTAELTDANRRLGAEILLQQQAEEKARQLAITDDLTGLHNRRGFLLLADQQWRMTRRLHGSCVLVYVDLDGLKQVNDTQGHAAGDALIVDAAGVLSKAFRESDVLARLGGDEFAVLAFVGNANAAVGISQRLDETVAALNQQPGRLYQLSMSFGIQELPEASNVSLGDLLAQADQAMFAQKREKKRQW